MTTPRISLTVPPGFTGLSLAGNPETLADRIRSLAGELAPRTGVTAAELAFHLARVADWTGPHGVRLLGKFAVGDPDPALASLTLMLRPLGGVLPEPREEAVAGLGRSLRERRPSCQIRPITLAAGPAIAVLTEGEFRFPDDRGTRPVFRIDFHLPTPGGRGLVVLSVSADTGERQAEIATAAVRVANSIRVGSARP
ncbi:hypothetical protein [Amycolatopsis albispora]|nr:hypothetical protein [Amycolatopsis albispora]